jgi:diketogulonate reductase-like aldo/keto reductase
VTPERIRQNFELFDFELSGEEVEAINRLDSGRRIGPDPETFVRP